jgi:hypothetical protein
MKTHALLKIAMCSFVFTALGACSQQSSIYWAKVCDEIVAGKDPPASGGAEVSRGLVGMPFNFPSVMPDPDRNPTCIVRGGLGLVSEKDRAEFTRAWEGAAYPQLVSVSGVGEWKTVQAADFGQRRVAGFMFSSVRFLGPGKFPAEICRAHKLDCVTTNPAYGCCTKEHGSKGQAQ